MKPLLRWLLDSVLPPSCLVCSEPVTSDGQFCVTCFGKVSFITPPFCRRCGVPFSFHPPGGDDLLCVACITSPPCFDVARAAVRYDETARRMVLPLKYGDRAETTRNLARLMARFGQELLQDATLLVPVPLHARRLRQRRYNQAALLATSLARLTGKPRDLRALLRTRPTRALEGMDAASRRKELEGAILPRPGAAVRGKRVLLIDDVMTTGSTANQCALALREAGAIQVNVLTIARVADRRL